MIGDTTLYQILNQMPDVFSNPPFYYIHKIEKMGGNMSADAKYYPNGQWLIIPSLDIQSE